MYSALPKTRLRKQSRNLPLRKMSYCTEKNCSPDKKRQARVELGEGSCEALNHLDGEIQKVRRSRKELRKLKKSIKPGHAVFGVDHDSGAVKGITVAATLKAIRGECLIKED